MSEDARRAREFWDKWRATIYDTSTPGYWEAIKKFSIQFAAAYAAAETERLVDDLKVVHNCCIQAEDALKEAEAERDRLRKALESLKTICFYIRNLSHRAWEDKKRLEALCIRIEEYAKEGVKQAETALQGDIGGER